MADGLIQALLAASQKDISNNPYLAASRSIGSFDPSGYDMSAGQSLLLGALRGLGGGFTQGLGESQVKKQFTNRADNVMKGLKSGKIMEALQSDPELASYAPMYEIDQQNQKADRLQELNKALVGRGIMLDESGKPTRFFDPVEEKAREAGLVKSAELAAARNALGGGSEVADEISLPGMFGQYSTTKSKRQSLIKEGISMGLTPNAAQEYADKNLATSTAMNKEAVKKIEAARSRASKLKELAAVADAGIQGAGQTGGPLWGLHDALSSAYSLISPEETQQRRAQAILESIEPEIIAASRPAGVGAMSDREMKSYLGAGPSSTKLPAENKALTEKMNNVAALEQEYGDFLEAYLEDKGDPIGADKAWAEYKAANPILLNGEWNTNRMPWQEYFSQRRGMASGENPEISAPVETKYINGQPVRVRRLSDGSYEEVE